MPETQEVYGWTYCPQSLRPVLLYIHLAQQLCLYTTAGSCGILMMSFLSCYAGSLQPIAPD